jgi:hypothetical protein
MSQTLVVYSRALRIAVMALAIFSAVAATRGIAEAQPAPPLKRWDFLIASGNVVPTGAQSDTLASGKLTTAQLSRQLNSSTAILGTFGWARTRGAAPETGSKVDVFVYDLGAEIHTPTVVRRLTFSSFAGAGGGGRSYSHRDGGIDASHQGSLYASAGGEIGFRRVQLRAEVRDYVSRFTPFDGDGGSSMRNDIAVMLGLRLGKRP